MSTQTENFKRLVKGNSVDKVIMALQMVSSDVRDELKEEYGVTELDELAFRLILKANSIDINYQNVKRINRDYENFLKWCLKKLNGDFLNKVSDIKNELK